MKTLLLALLALSLSACGNHAGSTASQSVNGHDGKDGKDGKDGRDGKDGNSLPKVYDKNGFYLGRFLSNGAAGNCFFLDDGALACIDGEGRVQNVTDDLSVTFVTCVFASADCSGQCRIPSSGRYRGALLPGFGKTLRYLGTEPVETNFKAASRLAADGTCNPDSGTYPSVVAPAPYAPSRGVAFPVAVPIFITQPGP